MFRLLPPPPNYFCKLLSCLSQEGVTRRLEFSEREGKVPRSNTLTNAACDSNCWITVFKTLCFASGLSWLL